MTLREALHRARLVVCFGLLLAVCAVTPVLAGDPPAEPREVLPPAPEQLDPELLPGPGDIAAAIAKAEAEEAERGRWLASPEAAQQRQASRAKFAGLGATEAQALLRGIFAEVLGDLESDPARYLSDGQLLTLGEEETAGTVRRDGEGALLDAAIPLRSENEEGELRKVDLTLETTAEGFETTNALVDVAIPSSASSPIEVGEEDVVAISQPGADPERKARRFGDKDAFYPNVLPDTDMLVVPTTWGVEIFNQLRSQESPETFRFQVDVPDGGALRADGDWGAKVVSGGKTIAVIPEPSAIDAQGTKVPVDMAIRGNSLVLRVDHRERDYAMPILLDPILEDGAGWYGWQNLAIRDQWAFTKNVAGMYGSYYCIYECFPWSGQGLYVSGQSGYYWPGQYAHWAYSAPNVNSYVTTPTLHPYVRHDHGCNAATTQYKQPHDYFGLWGHNNQWVYTAVNASNQPGNIYTLPFAGLAVIFGLSTGGAEFSMPCWRDLYAGGAHVWLDDWAAPTLNWASASPPGWVGDGTPITVAANATDAGLGAQFITVTQQGIGVIAQERPYNCTGTRSSLCPTNHTSQFGFTALSLGEGIRTLYASAQDPTGKGSGSYQFEAMIDRSEPHVTLDGQLAEVTEEDEGAQQGAEAIEKLRLPVYNLRIEASDGNPVGEPKDRRSGVKAIKVFLDDVQQQVPWSSQACAGPNYSCPMSVTYPLVLTEVELGEHRLKVLVEDQVGNSRVRNIDFEYFPATGMSDEYAMHYFSLPDGQEAEEGERAGPELAVNVMNGNLVYREKDIDVDGSALDLEVERYYNSQLPDSQSTEWGEGWTLAQTPELEPEAGPSPAEAELLDSSGALAEEVTLPTELGGEEFDPQLQATLTRHAEGYELRDETGESAATVAFDETGRTQELRTGGEAKIDYAYEGDELSEISVHDPGSAGGPTEEPEEGEGEDPQIPAPELSSDGGFGSTGSGPGQLDAPSRVAIGPGGDIWVTDTDNDRVQRFDRAGEFVSAFGGAGSGNGQLSEPLGIDVDLVGNVYVVDAGNDRVQKFDEEGEYLDRFGTEGTGEGQFDGPTGIAVDEDGNVYIADSDNNRIQRFDAEGEYLTEIGEPGTGDGELDSPFDVAVDPAGDLLVVDSSNHRIQRFSREGEYLGQFGTEGDEGGQFQLPSGIAAGPDGRIWVTDSGNDRVQVFDFAGGFLAEFGSAGDGAAQFDLPYGVALSASGQRAWVADRGNDRIRSWAVAQLGPEDLGSVPVDDPAVEIAAAGGLVESVEGEAAGEHAYEHEGGLLVAHDGPAGEVTYEYDSAQRMTKVTLANGTWAEIEYEQKAGRVASVTVDPDGEAPAETTEFEYTDASGPEEARRTTVIPEAARRVFYDVGADGSMLKWRNAEEPPQLHLAGTLYDNREVDGKLIAGDHLLEAPAFSAEGIRSIEVIAGGNALVDELHCDPEEPVAACEDQVNQWVMETASNVPGHLTVEVIATDRAGQSASERFWVDVPGPPPPLAPGTPVPPTFNGIKKFRQDYGLEVVFPVADEIELNERIFDLITAWWNPQTPMGEVARASYERWGVPMRPVDVAEMEYREWFLATNGALLDGWYESTKPSSYAGYYIDHEAGGVFHIGFNNDQAAATPALVGTLSLVAPERVETFPTQPAYDWKTLNDAEDTLIESLPTNSALDSAMSDVGLNARENRVELFTQDVPAAEGAVGSILGGGHPVIVRYSANLPEPTSGRVRVKGRMLAGDRIVSLLSRKCTAGFGTYKLGKRQPNGKRPEIDYLLTAGHCSGLEQEPFYRSGNANENAFGFVQFDLWTNGPNFGIDAEAIRLANPEVVPKAIYTGNPRNWGVQPAVQAFVGDLVYFSGSFTGSPNPRGEVVGRAKGAVKQLGGRRGGGYWVEFEKGAVGGDSGSPVFKSDGSAIGLVASKWVDPDGRRLTRVQPLLPPPNMRKGLVPGILESAPMAPMYVRTGPEP